MRNIVSFMLYALFLAWVITQANLGNKSVLFSLVGLIPLGDKIGHLILFGCLSALTIIATKYKSLTIGQTSVPVGALLVLFFALIEEGSQLFFENRNFDLYDLFADVIGICLSVIIIKKYRTNITGTHNKPSQ